MNCANLYRKIAKFLVVLTLLPCLFLTSCFGKDEKAEEKTESQQNNESNSVKDEATEQKDVSSENDKDSESKSSNDANGHKEKANKYNTSFNSDDKSAGKEEQIYVENAAVSSKSQDAHNSKDKTGNIANSDLDSDNIKKNAETSENAGVVNSGETNKIAAGGNAGADNADDAEKSEKNEDSKESEKSDDDSSESKDD